MTARDLEILAFLGRMRFATAAQLARAFTTSTDKIYLRCDALHKLGLLRQERILYGEPGVYLATRAGLGLAGCDLAPARIALATFRHDLALVSLCLDLLERHPGSAWQSERELRGGPASGAGPRHRPDGVLCLPGGRRLAVELELTPKAPRRLAAILRFYARCRDYDGVRYFLPTEAAVAQLNRACAAYSDVSAELWLA